MWIDLEDDGRGDRVHFAHPDQSRPRDSDRHDMSNDLMIPEDNEERKVDLVTHVDHADTYAERRQLKRRNMNPLSNLVRDEVDDSDENQSARREEEKKSTNQR
jgi:hypothetical protein